MTSSPFDNLGRIRHVLTKLDPHSLKAAKKRLERGGLPSNSIPEAISGGREHDHELDRYDEKLWALWGTYTENLSRMASLGEEALRLQNSVLIIPELLPDEAPIPCSNIACNEFLEPGRKKGECSRCRVWRHRQGRAYPQKRETEAKAG